MTILYPLIFKFGEVIEEEIGLSQREKYLNLSRTLFNTQELEWPAGSDKSFDHLFYTTNIDKYNSQINPDFIISKFSDWRKKYPKSCTADGYLKDDVALVIDFQNIDRDIQIYHFSLALSQFLSKAKDCSVIIIAQSVPKPDDSVFQIIFDLRDQGKLIVVDKNYQTIVRNKSEIISKFDLANKPYPEEKPLDGFKSKIIRKIGHFSPLPGSEICSRYFYDAQYSGTELRKLILQHILSLDIPLDQFKLILFASKFSPWLSKNISALSGDIQKDLKDSFTNYQGAWNVDQIKEKKQDAVEGQEEVDVVPKFKDGHILLITDCINKARTIRAAIKNVMDDFNVEPGKNLHVFSILKSKENINEPDQSVKHVEVNGVQVTIPYILAVELGEKSKRECKLCALGMPYGNLEEDDHFRLRSYDFWQLSDDSGYEFEIFKPEYNGRKKLYVPKFSKWFDENAAYLAYKFRRFVDKEKIASQLNRVIIYPDERKKITVTEDVKFSASGKLADKLKEMFNYNIIGIPRSVIDQVTNSKIGLAQIKALDQQWVKSIKAIPLETEIIILDEFHNGGKTFESIREIIKWLENEPAYFFSIADFNPIETNTYKARFPELEFYNLYEFNNHLYHEPK